MVLYAHSGGLRARQLANDTLLAAGVAFFWWLGNLVNRLVHELEAPGRLLEGAGGDLTGAASGASGRVDDLPVVGDRLAAPFDAVAEGGRSLARAGVSQQDVVGDLALWLGLIVALLPIAWLLARYLPGRIRWVRDASAATRLLATAPDARLFALRALATQPLVVLERAAADPLGAYESGDHRALAQLELNRLGLRL